MENLILASQSQARQSLLAGAGLSFTCQPAHIDEDSVKQTLKQQGKTASDLALKLAQDKALKISTQNPDSLIIGGDQTLDCNGTWLDKPTSRAEAKNHLTLMRNTTHSLYSAVCLAQGGDIVWQTVSPVHLTTWDYPDTFMENYLNTMGDGVMDTVGGYKLEHHGATLFSQIQGDYFTVLGLPLLPLLNELRNRGILC